MFFVLVFKLEESTGHVMTGILIDFENGEHHVAKHL